MSSPLFLLAEASGGLTETITKISNDFGVDAPRLIAQIFNFSFVAFVLWKFAFKPIMGTIQERQKLIDDGLKYSEQMKVELASAKEVNEQQLKEAQNKAAQFVTDTQKASKDFADKQQQEAIEKANAILAKAQAAIELEKKKMLAEARSEISRLVIATTQKVLARELTDADRSRYNDAASKELTNV
jgi:F-type H+-transporting ATPase subunit b